MSDNQTAVEWLIQQIEEKNGKDFSSYYSEFVNQAKAMEKEQIEGAYFCGSQHSVSLNVKRFKYTWEESEVEAKEFYQTNYGGHN
jgi:hypothetical protein